MKKKPTKKKVEKLGDTPKIRTGIGAVAVRKPKAPALQTIKTVDDLMALAIKEKSSMEQLDRLMQMKYRHEEREAKKEFFMAMSRFQAEVGVMEKTGKVGYRNKDGSSTNYKYAPLGQIEKQIKEPLARNLLSKSFEIDDSGKIKVTCIVTHANGHSEKTSMEASPDDSGKKNSIQSRGSTTTYLTRYTLLARLGLVTADQDNDGQTADDKEPKKPMTAPKGKKTYNTKPGDVLPPVKPTTKRDAILSTLNGSWNALRLLEKGKEKKKYDKKYYTSALGMIGCEKTADCTDAQLIELTKELDIERRNA